MQAAMTNAARIQGSMNAAQTPNGPGPLRTQISLRRYRKADECEPKKSKNAAPVP
jgi:hypothetical protein